MHDQNSQTPDELELVLQNAGRLISGGVTPAEFLEWFRTSVPAMAPIFASAMTRADGDTGKLIYGMGRALWNAMPQPSNRYRPRPLPKPDRNGKCPCGSGKKHKQCCARLEPPRELFESMNLLRYVLDEHSKASLRRIDARMMDPAALDDVAQQWTQQGQFERALALLEPLFDADTSLPEHAEILLDTLFDIWPPNHAPTRRRQLAERLVENANPGVACVALHRFIVMLADEGKVEEAWARFHDGMRQYPEDVNFAGLEITLLLRDNRRDEAKRRAEFWAHWLRRKGSEYADYAQRLLSMVESGEDPDILEQLRSESPLIDILAHVIETPPVRIDGYAPRPTDIDEPIVLAAGTRLAAIERRWTKSVGGGKPSLDMLYSDHEGLGPEQIVTLLEQDPTLLNSFEVLDDISASLDKLTDDWVQLGVVLELVLKRGETMLFAILTGRDAEAWVTADTWRDALPDIVHEMPWGFLENRPAMRMLDRHIDHLSNRTLGGAGRWLPLAQLMLRINPNDNHGYRDLVSAELLRQRLPSDVLQLLEAYPDDALGAICMNRVLALFLLDRREEAADALSQAGPRLREIRKSITLKRYPRPRDLKESMITIGGRDEAWIYRQEMLTTWQEVGAVEWLQQLPIPRMSPRRKNRAVDTETFKTRGTPVVSTGKEPSELGEVAERSLPEPVVLSHEKLRGFVDDLAPHGEWLLGLTLAAALTPGGGFAVSRLFGPWLERLSDGALSGDGFVVGQSLSDAVNIANEDPMSESMSEDVGNSTQLNRSLGHFLDLYMHFLARLDSLDATSVASAPAAATRDSTITDASFDWVTEDLSVLSLDEPEVRLDLVSGLVAGIDGNPRGWNPIPTGARNNVIGPLRLMVASAAESTASDDPAWVNISLLDPDDSPFQLSREKCLERIIDLVRLAKLSHIARR